MKFFFKHSNCFKMIFFSKQFVENIKCLHHSPPTNKICTYFAFSMRCVMSPALSSNSSKLAIHLACKDSLSASEGVFRLPPITLPVKANLNQIPRADSTANRVVHSICRPVSSSTSLLLAAMIFSPFSIRPAGRYLWRHWKHLLTFLLICKL